MACLRPFRATDLFDFNAVNLDHWTETYSISYYLSYLATWPDLSFTQLTPDGSIMGYVIGKAEGRERDSRTGKLIRERHGHVTAITVAPEYRRLGVARGLMQLLERSSDEVYKGYFVDLFVRPSNETAVGMYESMGYDVYRRVSEYYQGGGPGGKDEDGLDMRKALSRDSKRMTVRDSKVGRNTVVKPEATVFEAVAKPR